MHDSIRRLSLMLIITCAGVILAYFLRGNSVYGLFHLIRGERVPEVDLQENRKLASRALMRQDEISSLARASEEQERFTQRVLRSVVTIAAKSMTAESRLVERRGLGAIISVGGLIITENSTISGATEATVTLYDQTSLPAKLRAVGPLGVSFLEIEKSNREFHPLRVSPRSPNPGQIVFSTTGGRKSFPSLTQGILSRVSSPNPQDAQANLIEASVQGSSGGPLLDVVGDILGINLGSIDELPSSNGLSIGAGDLSEAMNRLLKFNALDFGYLGVQATDSKPGARITHLRALSPAAEMGLRTGDVVSKFNEKAITQARQFIQEIHQAPKGQKVRLSVRRDQAEITLDGTVGTVGEKQASPEKIRQAWDLLGLRLREMSPQELHALGFDPWAPGLRVTEIRADSIAAPSIKVSDIVHSLDEVSLFSQADFCQALMAKASAPFTLLVTSKGSQMTLQFTGKTPPG